MRNSECGMRNEVPRFTATYFLIPNCPRFMAVSELDCEENEDYY
jgi:hypothetical protein